MTPRRAKTVAMLAGLALAALALIGATQSWFVVQLSGDETITHTLDVGGDVAAPVVSALALACAALVGALAIASPLFRVILAVLQALLGVGISLSAATALSAPVTAAAPVVSNATGIAGESSIRALIDSVTPTAWPWLTLIVGVLTTLLAAYVVVAQRRWPLAGDKYRNRAPETATPAGSEHGSHSAVSDWDALSDGTDPTDTSSAGDDPRGPDPDASERR